MKLATLKDGTRDGTLLVVSRDLKHAAKADHLAPTLQSALDDWDYASPLLEQLYNEVNDASGPSASSRAFELDPRQLMAPLARAYQWLDASAYLNHVELVRKARGAEMPPEIRREPLMYQGASDAFIGPCDDVVCGSEDWGIDLEAELVAILGDVPMGIEPDKAGQHIRLLALVNDVSLRNLIPAELAKGFGFLNGKPWTAFSPVAVTPDELGEAWDGKRAHLPLVNHVNGELLGKPNCGADMNFHYPRLIAHAAKTRALSAGTVLGAGTVSNRDRSTGCGCLAEKRAIETIEHGKPSTSFLKFGDRVRIEMLDADGKSIFGAIDQQIVKLS